MEKIDVIASLLPVHALFNLTIALLFIVQAAFGLIIMSRRRAARPPMLKAIRLHRKLGPILVMAGVTGFFSGWILVFYHYCSLFHYPLHSIIGLSIALLLIVNFYISRRIRGAESPWRINHFRLGLLTLCLYGLQVFLGIGILF
jgi:hypothetical protein